MSATSRQGRSALPFSVRARRAFGLAALCLIYPLIASAGSPLFTDDRGPSALNHAVPMSRDEALDRFALGHSFFSTPWVEAPASTTARDGLGPLFNANSCSACHRRNGGGLRIADDGRVDQSIVLRVDHGAGYGGQIATRAIPGVPPEARVTARIVTREFSYPDGAKRILRAAEFSLEAPAYGEPPGPARLYPRRAPALTGLGLVERIPREQILARADPEDRDGDGISGEINRVWSRQHRDWRLGRFGWKAEVPNLLEQTARALAEDMGLTSPWFADEICAPLQVECARAYSSPGFDAPAERVAAIAFYLGNLRAPRPPPPSEGSRLFAQVGCQDCHSGGYRIDEHLTVDPYSDFLLHDMGTGLADGSRVYSAGPGEWRTPPLWGLGLAAILHPDAGYLHDGRAATIEQAILWHAGEAEAARVEFTALDASKRASLLKFLESL